MTSCWRQYVGIRMSMNILKNISHLTELQATRTKFRSWKKNSSIFINLAIWAFKSLIFEFLYLVCIRAETFVVHCQSGGTLSLQGVCFVRWSNEIFNFTTQQFYKRALILLMAIKGNIINITLKHALTPISGFT